MAENMDYPQDAEKNEYRYIHYAWLDEIAMELTAGAKKHPGETWREIPSEEHVSRAIRHLSMHLTGDSSKPHLIHASMRCMMAFATETGVRMPMELADEKAPQVTVTAEEMAMLTGKEEAREEAAKPEEKQAPKRIEKICAVCGRKFAAQTGRSKYCSTECRKEVELKQYRERCMRRSAQKEQKPAEEVSRTKEPKSAKKAEEARRKESAAHLGELTKTAREAGMSYGKYMAQKRITEGCEKHG